MSDSTLTLKKAIPIIAVTWILSLATTLAVVYIVPIILRPTWHEVAKFTGDSTIPDNAFDISSNHWRIRWFASPNPLTEDTSFWFWMFKPADESLLPYFDLGTLTESDFEKQFMNQCAGVEYITGAGRFVIDVWADNASWEIIVEAYY